jgi:acetoin:2,6-dichlorophenolindophenol oxidoreductase subunit alpha
MNRVSLSADEKRALLRTMLLIRRFEERVKILYAEKTIVGAIHLTIGQEAVAAGVCAVLRRDDYVFSTHRGHGHAIAKGADLRGIMAELMGRDTGLSRGHGGSMHLFSIDDGLMGGNGIVGGGIPLALGGAFSAQYAGSNRISATFFSDGAANQGVFSESLNLAALFGLPVLFVCENNGYAATTPVAASTARVDIAGRARAYGVSGTTVDGNDALAVRDAAAEAVACIRRGEGPRLIECRTYRVEPHCGIIADERTPGEKEKWLEKDPIDRLRAVLQEEGGFSASDLGELERDVMAQIDEAVSFGRESPWPDPHASHNRCWTVEGDLS